MPSVATRLWAAEGKRLDFKQISMRSVGLIKQPILLIRQPIFSFARLSDGLGH